MDDRARLHDAEYRRPSSTPVTQLALREMVHPERLMMRLERAFGGMLGLAVVVLLAGCAYEPPNPYPPVADVGVWGRAPGGYVVENAPLEQPDALFIDTGPPPLVAEIIPPRPYGHMVWVPGYWGWQSRWVWAPGRWLPPPRPGYVWMNPYYEQRSGFVVFVSGFWCPPHAMFAPPPPYLRRPVRSAGGLPPLGPPGRPVPRPWPSHAVQPPPSSSPLPPYAGPRPGVVGRPPLGAVARDADSTPPGGRWGSHRRPGWQTSPSQPPGAQVIPAPAPVPAPPPAMPEAQGGEGRAHHGLIGRPVPRRDNPPAVVVPRGKPWQQDADGGRSEGAPPADRRFLGRSFERRGER